MLRIVPERSRAVLNLSKGRVQAEFVRSGLDLSESPGPAGRNSVLSTLIESATFPGFLWLMLWASINTGWWALEQVPSNTMGWIEAVRAAGPLLVLVPALVVLACRSGGQVWRATGPARLWIVYALVGIIGLAVTRQQIAELYWILAYLSAFAVVAAYSAGRDVLANVARLNRFSWLVMTGIFLVMVFIAREQLLVHGESGWTGYNALYRVYDAKGVWVSRSSGMSRFAAVPGIAAFVLMLRVSGWRKVWWALPVLGAAVVIYLMQSRGTVVSYAFALAFAMLLMGRHTRAGGAVILALVVLLAIAGTIPDEVISHIVRDPTTLPTLTNRTVTWHDAWLAALESPLVGWGPQADRALLDGQHAHNTYVYGLLQSGFLGLAFFVAGMIWTWHLFFKLLRDRIAERLGQRGLLIQTGAILAFFTLRGIPEVSGTLYGVDFLLMLSVLAYFDVLDREGRRRVQAMHGGPISQGRRAPLEVGRLC
ncbi:MAG TPA: O-antigen ligase family protein [Phycisphaerae bacterium]|nr:O-antigen ligase family protein [Phycisphaerae bacterium]